MPQTPLTLLTDATAANGAPSGATAGVAMIAGVGANGSNDCSLLVETTVTGAGTVNIKLWGYATGHWFELEDFGVMSGTTTINKAELCTIPEHFSRLYAEVVSISGTSASVTATAMFD